MVDSRKAFDPTTTAFHTGFLQAETHRIVDPSTEKQMKQSPFFLLLAVRCSRLTLLRGLFLIFSFILDVYNVAK